MEKNTNQTPENKRDEFYKKLRESLENTTKFPADYLFKFIVPTEHTALHLEKDALHKEKEQLKEHQTEEIKDVNKRIQEVQNKIKAEDAKLEQVDTIFKNKNANIQTKKSKSGKYTSKTIKVKMDSSDDVIKSYKEAEGIDGIISL